MQEMSCVRCDNKGSLKVLCRLPNRQVWEEVITVQKIIITEQIK